jgi:hypothetical protein
MSGSLADPDEGQMRGKYHGSPQKLIFGFARLCYLLAFVPSIIVSRRSVDLVSRFFHKKIG